MATETAPAEVLATFRIPDANLSALTEKIAKMSKKAQKLVGQPIVLTVVSTENVERVRHNQYGKVLVDINGNPEGTGIFDRFHNVTVSGPRSRLNGWEFVAALDVVTLDDGQQSVMVRTAPGKSIPPEIRNHTEGCDHCRTHRSRKTLYVVKKES
jgi:hypothetical protein